MGTAGSGKTTVSRVRPAIVARNSLSYPQFINLASGSNLRVGMDSTVEVQLTDAFTLDGKEVALVDIPGFDDASKSDPEVLRVIADFLTNT